MKSTVILHSFWEVRLVIVFAVRLLPVWEADVSTSAGNCWTVLILASRMATVIMVM